MSEEGGDCEAMADTTEMSAAAAAAIITTTQAKPARSKLEEMRTVVKQSDAEVPIQRKRVRSKDNNREALEIRPSLVSANSRSSRSSESLERRNSAEARKNEASDSDMGSESLIDEDDLNGDMTPDVQKVHFN